MTTANREYEALTTVEAVQKAFADGREVEYRTWSDRKWARAPSAIGVASDFIRGWEYRAHAASVGDAPSYAVADELRWALQGLPTLARNLLSEGQTSRSAVILRAVELLRNISLTAPPAAPVVSESDALLIERAKDRRDMLLNWRKQMPAVWYGNSTLDGAAKVIDELLLRLSVPATDDKAPAVDAEPEHELLTTADDIVRALNAGRVVEVEAFAGAWLCVSATASLANIKCDLEDHGHRFRANAHYDAAIRRGDAAPTSPHDVDAVRVDEAMVERFVDAYDDVYEAEVVARGVWSDNKNAAVIAGLTAALRKPGGDA